MTHSISLTFDPSGHTSIVTPGSTDDNYVEMIRTKISAQNRFNSQNRWNREQRLVVVGTEKMAVFDDVVSEGKLKVYPGHTTGEPEVVAIGAGEPLRAECEHFLECIEAGSQPLTGGESGVQVARVLEACQRSLDEHGARVGLAEVR